jgi:pyrroloquinoline quinone biosynthesis protein B
MQLGREVANTSAIPVYVLPHLKKYLEDNGPWSQLVKLKNISLIQLDTAKSLVLTNEISIQTFTVPHRDEFSETAGFVINAGDKKYLFIPDIDKWQKWNKSIVAEVKKVDVAFLDGTFNDVDELTNRKIEEVPHPFIPETMALFETEEKITKNKIHFIHLNHSNKVLWEKATRQKVIEKGFNAAEQDRSY